MKICPVCGKTLQGRIDKIYCTPKCKNVAQYEKRVINERFYLFVDKQLKTNRKILKRHNQSGFTTIRKTYLFRRDLIPNISRITGKIKKDRHTCFVMTMDFWISGNLVKKNIL